MFTKHFFYPCFAHATYIYLYSLTILLKFKFTPTLLFSEKILPYNLKMFIFLFIPLYLCSDKI